MRKKIFYFLAGFSLAGYSLTAQAVTGASVASIPEGFFSFTFPATAQMPTTTYLSLPLASSPSYSGAVASVTATSISVSDTPSPWAPGTLTNPSIPYFVKFLSGRESGRVVKVTANTSTSLTVDVTDNSSQTVPLTASGFAVEAGDTFEVFIGDTLASVFGSSTAHNVLKGGTNAFVSDTVSVYSPAQTRWQTYFFNTTAGYWTLYGEETNANATVLYPYGALTVTRRAGDLATSLVLTGRVSEVAMLTKTTGGDTNTYSSTKYPSPITLSQLKFGSNWTQSTSPYTADSLAVWVPSLTAFETYYQLPDTTWRKMGSPSVDTSNLVVPAGTVVSILKRSAVSGATSFLQSALPYSIN